jgi:single-strand DNA-binding protein
MMATEHLIALPYVKEIINKVIITGYIGKDPTFDIVGNNNKLAKFSLATNQETTNTKEGKPNTLWHNIVAWGKVAEQVRDNVKRGNRVTVEGRINYKQYTDKNGVKKTYTEIIMSDMLNHSKQEAA